MRVPRLHPPPGGFYTGGSPLNPARIFANMVVFRCDAVWGWTYLAAHLAAIGAAVAWVWPVHGLGMFMGGEVVGREAKGGGKGERGRGGGERGGKRGLWRAGLAPSGLPCCAAGRADLMHARRSRSQRVCAHHFLPRSSCPRRAPPRACRPPPRRLHRRRQHAGRQQPHRPLPGGHHWQQQRRPRRPHQRHRCPRHRRNGTRQCGRLRVNGRLEDRCVMRG